MPPKDSNTLDKLNQLKQMEREALLAALRSSETNYDSDPIFQEDDQKKIAKSNTGTILHLHELVRLGMIILFWLSVSTVAFSVGIIFWLVYEYVGLIVQDPGALKEQLAYIWTVLSGAFVIVFFNFVINVAKKLSLNGTDDKSDQ